MSPTKIRVPAWEWYGWGAEELEFPDGWDIHERRMMGHDAPPLYTEAIAERLREPVGTPLLSELANGK